MVDKKRPMKNIEAAFSICDVFITDGKQLLSHTGDLLQVIRIY